MQIISAVHAKWVLILRSLGVDQLYRMYIHPESNPQFSMAEPIGLYS